MLGLKQAAQLLRREWPDVNTFALELYAAVTSKTKKTIDGPVEIVVPKGKTALRIVASSEADSRKAAGPAAKRSEPAARQPLRDNTRPAGAQVAAGRPSAQQQDQRKPRPEIVGPELPLARQPSQPVLSGQAPARVSPEEIKGATVAPFMDDTPSVVDRGQRKPSDESARLSQRSSLESRQPSGVSPHFTSIQSAGNFPSKGAGDDGPPEFSKTPDSGVLLYKGQSPRNQPAVEVVGSVLFAGSEPVSFDVAPTIWSPRNQSYRPIHEWASEELTHIKRARQNYDPMIGKVVSGTGNVWRVRIYWEGPNEQSYQTQETEVVEVVVLNMPPNYKVPEAGTWIGPLVRFPSRDGVDEDDWFFCPSPDWFGGLQGKTKVGGIGAINDATGEPGSGTCDIYTWDRVPGHAPTVWKTNQTVYNTIGSVSSDKWIQVKMIGGAFYVDVARCS